VYLWRPLRFEERDCILRPGAANIGLCLLMALAHPWSVMPLRDLHVSMPEQNRSTLKRYASEQQLERKRVSEAVRVAVCDLAALLKL